MNRLERLVTSAFVQDYTQWVGKGTTSKPLSEFSEKEQQEYWRRDAELHPSSFPYCALRGAYARITREADPVLERGFGFDYFLPVGTATHVALQRWLGRSGNMIGNWTCCCKRRYAFVVRPETCVRCGASDSFEYHELGGVWGTHTHWHCDGLFRMKDGSYWVVDYKTTSDHSVTQHRARGDVFPYKENVAQVEAYIILVEDQYKIEVRGWIIPYITRSNPLHAWKQHFEVREISKARKDELRALLRINDRDHGRALLVREQPERVFKTLVRTKPCKSRTEYKEHMFNQYNPCPLEKTCFNQKNLQQQLQNTINEYKESGRTE